MKLTKIQRAELHGKYDGRCAYCGCNLPERWQADHLEPVCRNPLTGEVGYRERDTMENMMPSCAPCNNYKHSMSLEGWRRCLNDLLGNLQRNSTAYRHALRFGMVDEKPMPVTFYFENGERRHE